MSPKINFRKLGLRIFLFLVVLIIVNYNFQAWRSKNRIFNESVGTYIYDTTSRLTVILSNEEYQFLEGTVLRLNEDGTFLFSKTITKFGANNGTWSVSGQYYSHWLDFKFENGLSKQVGPCFENRVDFFYPNNRDLLDTSLNQKPNGTIFFVKIGE